MRKLSIILVLVFVVAVLAAPVYAQTGGDTSVRNDLHWLAMAMGVAAAGCGIAQSRALAGGCESVARNPGAVDTIRFFIILGLAFIEFLALLTFVVVMYVLLFM